MDWVEGEPPKNAGNEQFLVMNNRQNCAVVIWRDGWVPMFSDGAPNAFLNGGCGSVITHWRRIVRPTVD